MKRAYTWPNAEIWVTLRLNWDYVKDQNNILLIVDAGPCWIEAFSAGNKYPKKSERCTRCTSLTSFQDMRYQKC